MNILIVDDEMDSLNEIEYCVKKHIESDLCVACSNALEALEEAGKMHFDIAFLDIEMPVMNGLELAERLNGLCPHIEITFVTAYNHYAAEAFEVNAIDYILKPIREERIFKALAKLKRNKPGNSDIGIGNRSMSICMFGKFIVRQGDEILKCNRKKSFELLAYLLENKEMPVHKEKLCELLWPDLEPKKALVNLQTAIYSIRKMFEAGEESQICIEYVGSNYTLYIKDTIIDAVQFESMLQKALDLKDAALLKQAVDLYTGDYLEEEGWLWAEPQKVLLRKKYVWALQWLKKNKG